MKKEMKGGRKEERKSDGETREINHTEPPMAMELVFSLGKVRGHLLLQDSK